MYVFREEIYCDFQLETNDGKIINGHKVVLASASPYFHAVYKLWRKKSISCYYETVRFNSLTAVSKLYLYRGNHGNWKQFTGNN